LEAREKIHRAFENILLVELNRTSLQSCMGIIS
jgi:hypothetical protein